MSRLAGAPRTCSRKFLAGRRAGDQAGGDGGVVEDLAPGGIRTTSGPTPFVYRYRFAEQQSGKTLVHVDAAVELAGVEALLARLAGRAVRRGVNDNLAALKKTLEMGATSP